MPPKSKTSSRYSMSPGYKMEAARGGRSYDPEVFVEAMYEGKKSALRPLYEKLVDLGLSLGKDVKVCPCETIVPFYRAFVFAQVTPGTNEALDLGLALGDLKVNGRVEPLRNSAGNRITHRIRLGAGDPIDAEVRTWIEKAYALGNEARKKPSVEGSFKLPVELKKALAGSKPATSTWETLTPRMKADWVDFISQAAREETRAKRLGQCIEKLAAGKKRMY